jgi:long-chain acyl-CoA synthetase
LNRAEAAMFAKANKIEFENFVDLTKNEQIYSSIKETIERANAKLSSPEQIKKFKILERDFSLEEDEITPTMKLKRSVVSDRFQKEIEILYQN